jgi:hypothetical protein
MGATSAAAARDQQQPGQAPAHAQKYRGAIRIARALHQHEGTRDTVSSSAICPTGFASGRKYALRSEEAMTAGQFRLAAPKAKPAISVSTAVT